MEQQDLQEVVQLLENKTKHLYKVVYPIHRTQAIVNLLAYYKYKYNLSTLDINPIKFEVDTYISITFHYPINEDDPSNTQSQRNLIILEFTQKLLGLGDLGMSNISSNEITPEIVQITFKVEQPKS